MLTYANQDFDEQQRILSRLENDMAYRTELLRHPDSQVRCWTDWTLEYFGLRTMRPVTDRNRQHATTALINLWRALTACENRHADMACFE